MLELKLIFQLRQQIPIAIYREIRVLSNYYNPWQHLNSLKLPQYLHSTRSLRPPPTLTRCNVKRRQ